jgi:hypothetical protein
MFNPEAHTRATSASHGELTIPTTAPLQHLLLDAYSAAAGSQHVSLMHLSSMGGRVCYCCCWQPQSHLNSHIPQHSTPPGPGPLQT